MTRIWGTALWVGVLALGLGAGAVFAQESSGGAEAENRVEAFLASGGADPVAPSPEELRHLDEAGREALARSLEAYYLYRISGFEHRRAVFDWQLFSSKVIFAVAILLVAVGVYFSWLQFMASGQAARPDKSAAPGKSSKGAAEARDLSTSIEASPGGLKVSSPVLGVVILAISLAFFYLYLVHVYPVSELF